MQGLVIRGARVYSPRPLGVVDVLVMGDRVAAIGHPLEVPAWAHPIVEIDGTGLDLIPGLIDQHVHIAGGGGEGGPINRTPEIMLTQLTLAGITTVVGVLGTDGTTRSVQGLLAKARALEAEGLQAFIYTGAYQVPTRTITENARTDLILIDKVIGVGEIALSDFRGSHPSDRELARLAGEARVGGLLGGKAGVLHCHIGDGQRGLDPLHAVVKMADVPIDGLIPTHLNRNPALLDQALAWAKMGGFVDLTTGIRPDAHDTQAVSAHQAAWDLRSRGADWALVSFSSDAQGSSPIFDRAGHLTVMGVGQATTLLEEVVALSDKGLPLEEALMPATTVPRRILHLADRGLIAPDGRADLVLLADRRTVHTVVASGQVMVQEGRPVRWGRFENQGSSTAVSV